MRTLTIITGSRQGLGRALVAELLAGLHPVITLSRARPQDPRVRWIGLDLSTFDTSDHDALSDSLESEIRAGTPDRLVFINNAAVIGPIGAAAGVRMDALLDAVKVNFSSPAAIAGIIAAKAGKLRVPFEVLDISSGAALRPIAGWAAYCSTKIAIRSFLDVLAIETGASVHHIDPGVMDTRMQREIRASSSVDFPELDRFLALAEEGHLTPPEVVATRIVRAHYAPARAE